MKIALLTGIFAVSAALGLQAATIVSGSATLTLKEGMADSIDEFDAYFNGSTSRADTLALAAPGNAPFIENEEGVQLVDPIRPFGEVPAGYPGSPGASRSPQITNLDFDPNNILGSWSASVDQFGTFVNLGGTGEQIALTSMQRWTGPFTGSLLYGDFALRYVPGRAGTIATDGILSGLVLTSNIDFLNSSWADLANASISFDELTGTLLISGDLLISGALNVLDPSAAVGTNFGSFALTAQAIPEPSTWMLLALGAGMVGLVARRRLKNA